MKSKKTNKNNRIFPLIILAGIVTILFFVLISKKLLEDRFDAKKITLRNNLAQIKNDNKTIKMPVILPTPIVSISAVATLSASTSAKLSFEEMNKLYGPCVKLSVLMYHHVQEEADAKAKNQGSLTVTPEFFQKQMQYLKDKNYNIITPENLKDFFNGTGKIANKSVMITLDDGYVDNYQYAYPILKNFGFRAVIFTPTGLLNNPGYLTWDQMSQMKDTIYFGNHTWSHHASSGSKQEQEKEIGTADQQLTEHGFNSVKIFAYPYGPSSGNAEGVLKEKGYTMAFTTVHGSTMCKGKYLELPRIRIGNAPLSSYGL